MPNVELLKRTLQHIETHLDEWNQEMWVNECGTAFCFAGHAVVLSGCKVDPHQERVLLDTIPADAAIKASKYVGGGWNPPIRTIAAILLGFDPSAEIRLFDGDNTLDKLRQIVAELCGETTPAGA